MKMHVASTVVAVALAALCTAAQADAVFSFAPVVVGAPDSRNFGNSNAATLATGTLAGTLPGPTYDFLDTWNFTLGPNANAGGFVGTFNVTGPANAMTQGIDNLQLRLIGPVGPASTTLVGWLSGTNLGGAQQVISLIPNAPLASGDYQLQVRCLLTGSAYSYAGTFQAAAVPVPPALPLLAAGLLVLTTLSRRTRL
jgi:hypothetical protein